MKTARRLDGRAAADRLLIQLTKKVKKYRRPITLATVLVGRRPDSVLYVSRKQRAAKKVGMRIRKYNLPPSTSQTRLKNLLTRLAKDSAINGILLQLPLPNKLNTAQAVAIIPAAKDVDGFHAQSRVTPPTIAAVLYLLRLAKMRKKRAAAIILAKQSVFSQILTLCLSKRGIQATPLSANQRIPEQTKKADTVITALGRGPRLTAAHIKPGAIIIDVGIRRLAGKIVGDADPSVWAKAKAVSPVPGGVGPLTVAYVLYNTYRLAFMRRL